MKQTPVRNTLDQQRPRREWRVWLIGALACLVFALLLSALMAWLSWQENPSQIFHRGGQTNWQFVWDTFWSWFVPSLYQSVLIFSVVRIVLLGIGKLRHRFASTGRQHSNG